MYRQPLRMENSKLSMDGTGSGSLKFKVQNGFFVPRWLIALLVLLFIGSLIAVGLLVYYLAPRPFTQQISSTGAEVETLARSTKPKENVLLPKSLKPLYYEVQLQPFLPPQGNSTFGGHVLVSCHVQHATTVITMHVNNISIDENSLLVKRDSQHLDVKDVTYNKDKQFVSINLKKTLELNSTVNVSMAFIGHLNDDMNGFYRSSYKDKNQNVSWLAVTQFQPTDARRAFPCFDEPDLKARFNITLIRPTHMTSISNMPIVKTIDRNDSWSVDNYQTTVAMSTYLLAFVVSDFQFLSNNASNTQFRVWARPEAMGQVEYALSAGPRALDFFQQYFNVPFPLPKQDMIAVPDFRAGAMENWGLITYRESALLWDPVVSSSSNKQRVLTVIAHELAHQWFGNLVTPKWWDDLWLNEGFASFMEYVGADHVEPSWKMLEQFIVRDLMGVFEMDSLKSSHPVSVPVNDPDEINEIFDSISYNKGSSIIRMMQHFLGESTFRKGLTNYLKEFSYKNANQDDLWQHLSKASKEDGQEIDVKSVMDLWTKQTGYPVLKVLRDYKSKTVLLTQKRFLMISKEGDDKDSQRWPLPLTFTSASTKDFNNTKPKSWFYKNNESVILSGNDSVPSSNDWIIFNVRLTSYYKTNYDQQNWRLLTEQLHSDHGVIHASNRAQLIDDSLDLARGGLLDYATSLNITYYLKKENEYVPWEAANQNFQFLDTMLQYTAAYGHWKAYIHRLIVPVFESVGFEESASDSHLNKMLRAIAISWACNVGHLECLKKAHSLYKQWMDFPTNDPIPPNLKRVISCWGIHEGGEKEWNFAFERYRNSNVASEKDILLGALACTKEVWLLGKYLNMTLDTSQGVRKQDSGSVFARVASSSIGRFLAFDFIRDKWLDIKALYGSGFFEISRMVQTVTASLNTKFHLKQLKEFIGDHKGELGTATRTFQQSLEETEANVKWMEQSYDKVSQWLENNK